MSLNVLLVAATHIETALIRQSISLSQVDHHLWTGNLSNSHITLLHTGIGMTNTAFQLGFYLGKNQPDLSINFGIGGSYQENWPLTSVVEIIEDTYAELGAEDGANFLNLYNMGFPLMKINDRAYYNTLLNPLTPISEVTSAKGVTVNTVSGCEESIALMKERWNKEIETMEGAAFFQAMLSCHIPFRAFRGISNYMRKRDTSQWQLKESSEAVQNWIIQMLEAGNTKSFF